MRGQAPRTSPQVSLPSPSLSRSRATSRSRRAMSQRTSRCPGAALSCRYESLALCACATHALAPSTKSASMRRSPRTGISEDGIDAPVVQADGLLQRADLLDRPGFAAGAGGLREHEQVERLALLGDVAARERDGGRRGVVDRQREHRLLAAMEEARIGALVGEGDAIAHLGDVALAAGRLGERAS